MSDIKRIFRINLSEVGRGAVTIIEIEKETEKLFKFKKRMFISQVKKVDLDKIITTAFKSHRAIFTADESRLEEHKKSLLDLMLSINEKEKSARIDNIELLHRLSLGRDRWIIKE